MHHLKFFERIEHERQIVKHRIEEFHQWLLTALENDWSKAIFSLNRSKLDQQLIEFRQFDAQFQTRRYSFVHDLNSSVNHQELFDEDDRHLLKFLDEHLHILAQQIQQCQERVNPLSICLHQFHQEHACLVDTYSKYLRLYTEQIQEINQGNFLLLESLLKENIFDQSTYERLFDELVNQSNIEDENEIIELDQQAKDYQNQYQIFYDDLKILLQNRDDYLQAKRVAEETIEQAQTLFTLNENLLLPLDNPSIELLVEKYQVKFSP